MLNIYINLKGITLWRSLFRTFKHGVYRLFSPLKKLLIWFAKYSIINSSYQLEILPHAWIRYLFKEDLVCFKPNVQYNRKHNISISYVLWCHKLSRIYINRNDMYMHHAIQCVPIKRKPGLSVRYLHCHASFDQTLCFIIKGIFSSFIWYHTHVISMHDWKGTI